VSSLERLWDGAGLDRFIGRKLPRLLSAAGLTSVGFGSTVWAHRAGDQHRTLMPTFVRLNA
jgi:hypothetical protein